MTRLFDCSIVRLVLRLWRRGRLDDRRGGISFGVHEFLDGRCGKIALGLRGRLEDRRGGAADVRLNLSRGFTEMMSKDVFELGIISSLFTCFRGGGGCGGYGMNRG
jgi:hypothetical protein